MPARLPLPRLLRLLPPLPAAPSRPLPAARPLSTTPTTLSPRPRDAAAAALRRNTNIARQSALKTARLTSASDPVLGTPTPFLSLLSTPPPPLPPVDWARANNHDPVKGHDSHLHLNHLLYPSDVARALKAGRDLTEPVRPLAPSGVKDTYIDPDTRRAHEAAHDHAVTAVQRIISLSLGSSADKRRVGTIRCIEMFGRHNTDVTLPADPVAAAAAVGGGRPEKTPRAGPDTGSSEVQVAVLTVKIRVLAEMVKRWGNKDKHNKRNLRLLCHRRQKLLKYLKRKEKGGVRYRNVMQRLGLDEGVFRELSM